MTAQVFAGIALKYTQFMTRGQTSSMLRPVRICPIRAMNGILAVVLKSKH